jgi:hypothetical protein
MYVSQQQQKHVIKIMINRNYMEGGGRDVYQDTLEFA